MSSTERQNRLLLAEDWKRIYQSFKYADFESYDFDNLRRVMINYIRQNYPEDFNDYIESSEYLALIDLIAFLGQNLAFRTDLNARENYIETADRRESVLRLARLISYNPKRNQAANGLLKIESISTTEDVYDSNGVNLSGQTVLWNDGSNADWYEQFIKVMNAALPTTNTFGRPVKKETINSVLTEQYRFNASSTKIPLYSFTKNIDSNSVRFEITSTNFENNEIYEEEPFPGNKLAFLYRDDGQGAGSNNSGFFCHFRQGSMQNNVFTINNPTPNTVVNVDTTKINNSDVWLYKLDSNSLESELWTKVDSIEGNNIIYNSINKNIRTIYSVLSRVDDKISLIFSDGVFGELPKGSYKVYYRTSINKQLKIVPSDLTNINLQIPYISKAGREETLNLYLELKYTVTNGTGSEDTASIKANAPSTYYTQNRLITGEDYNVGVSSVSQEIIKTKAVNRTSSGISRYFDLRDASGKYTNTLMFGNDGVIYKETLNDYTGFEFTTRTDVEAVIRNQIEPILKTDKIKNYYYRNFPRNTSVSELNLTWVNVTTDTNRSTGYFVDENDFPASVSSYTQSILRFIEPDALLKFETPAGYFFRGNRIIAGTPTEVGDLTYRWVKVISIVENGTVVNSTTGLGPIVFNDIIPSTDLVKASLKEIVPVLANSITTDVTRQVVDQIFAYKTFGLRYDIETRTWRVITNTNLNSISSFSLGKTGDNTNQQLDASWMLLFETDGEKYTVTSRGTRYIYESEERIRFYFDGNNKIYDSKTGKVIKDKITLLSNNNKPDSLDSFTNSFTWEVKNEFKNNAGYIDSKKIEIGFYDSDNDGVIDDPDIFDHFVAPLTNPSTKYIFQKKATINKTETYNYVDATVENINVVASEASIGAFSQYANGAVFYLIDKDIFKVLNTTTNTLTQTGNYQAFVGRSGIKFEYLHAADDTMRIDPSSSNIIDVYLLTRTYDNDYRDWVNGVTTTKPLPPSSDNLFLNYGQEINKIKSISDEVIYHPVKYKPLFGSNASVDLQAEIKIVKNIEKIVNDNEVKAKTIDAINEFFALENWDFGETFYFSELSTYIMNKLSPDVVSVVLVPVQETQSFGSLYEIKAENDEIFISTATVDDIKIIDAITASRLQASGAVISSSTTANSGVQSDTASSTYIITGGDNA